MSAFIAVVSGSTIRLFTDAALVNTVDGRLIGICEKVARWDDRPLAIAVQSDDAGTAGALSKALFVDRIGRKPVEEAFADLRTFKRPEGLHSSASLFLLAGVTRGGKPRMALFNLGAPNVDIEPWKYVEAPKVTVVGACTQEEANSLDFAKLEANPEKHAPSWFQVFRKPAITARSGGEFTGGGGHLHMTTITQEGATSRTIAYWPDWLGRPIDSARKFVPVLR